MMTAMMRNGLEEGFILDRQWFWLRGEMERTKRPALLALARVFAEAEVPYAIIGGIALQAHQAEPRTTLDIDVAVAAYSLLPRAQLEAAGFTCSGRFSHSENWIGPEGTPVQFTDDPALAEAITRAEEVELEDVRLRVISRADLLHAKLRAAADPARRRSKRLQDLVDAQALLESTPPLEQELSAEERALLDRLPR
jgi:Nucleotidyl transferase AbiEii toxin, Type IV TA system